MKIGFTGTRDGMTADQERSLYDWAASLPFWAVFHHGCCVGADAEAVEVFDRTRVFARFSQTIHAHPSNNWDLTDEVAKSQSDVVAEPRKPLDRNKVIVHECEVLVAAPGGPETLRSGTWSTVRYARRLGRRVIIVWPDGSVTDEAAK